MERISEDHSIIGANRIENRSFHQAVMKRIALKARNANTTNTITYFCLNCGRRSVALIGLNNHVRIHQPRQLTNRCHSNPLQRRKNNNNNSSKKKQHQKLRIYFYPFSHRISHPFPNQPSMSIHSCTRSHICQLFSHPSIFS